MERKKLMVLSVGTPTSVGTNGAQKLTCKVKEDGKEVEYFTFRNTLFDFVKPGEVDAEVDIQEREYNGKTYIDRKITNIFVQGQQVGGKGGISRKDTESIERQTAAKITAEMIIAGKLEAGNKLGIKLMKWLDQALTTKE